MASAILKPASEIIGWSRQLSPGTLASTGNSITAQVVTISELNNDPDTYESTLVKLENVSFVDADGTATFSNGTNYNLTDGSFTIPMRTEFYGVFTGEVIPSGTIDVTGVSGEYNGTAQVYARTVSDFSLSTNSFELSNFNLIPNPTNTGFVTIKSNQMGAVQAQVFDFFAVVAQNYCDCNQSQIRKKNRQGYRFPALQLHSF